MRIGLIIYGSLDTLSGGYLYDRQLVEYLLSQGDQVEIVSLPWRNYSRHLADNLSSRLITRLERLEVDVLLQDELNHPSLFRINTHLRRRAKYPLVSIVHHLRSNETRPAWQNRLYLWVERLYLTNLDGFVFNSKTTRGVVEGLVGGGQPAVVAHPAGDRFNADISDAEITARARQPCPLRILFLGNLIPRKGLHILLEAMASLPRGRFHLAVAGNLNVDRAYTRGIYQQVETRGIAEQVRFLGPLNEAGVAYQMKSSHVLVVPSFYEGFGIAYLEGMGSGLPAIATTSGAAGEIITHGENGFLVPPGDSRALAYHLLEWSASWERLLAMSLAARHRYTAHPTWKQTTERIRAFLKRF